MSKTVEGVWQCHFVDDNLRLKQIFLSILRQLMLNRLDIVVSSVRNLAVLEMPSELINIVNTVPCKTKTLHFNCKLDLE